MIKANALHIPLKDESMNCVVTSPPYWGLRKYDIPDLVWDDWDKPYLTCEHEWGEETIKTSGRNDSGEVRPGFHGQASGYGGERKVSQGQFCLHCSAWRGQLGLEPTLDLYVKHILDIFKEVWRVLRNDGTCWLNVGDSYAGSGRASGQSQTATNMGRPLSKRQYDVTIPAGVPDGLKPKDLCLIPFRLALALQQAGWWVRSDIIWLKPNPMPESVKDRPTRSHEYIFLLTKSSKYFWDQDAVREQTNDLDTKPRRFRNGNLDNTLRNDEGNLYQPRSNRNIRSVWTIATEPFPDAHYATFPQALVERCIKAGCPKDGVVLDPFAGSGTVIRVAERLCRKGIGLDLGYQELQEKRLTNVQKELQL